MATTVVKSALQAIRERGLRSFLRDLKEDGFRKCIFDGNLLQTKIHNVGATVGGVDKFGNKYYEKLGDTQSEHGWLQCITDHTGDEVWVEHKENLSGKGSEFIYHSKGHALNPCQREWTRHQSWQPTKPE
ncbi:hypothetical protein E1A91_A05G080400v1 [Gossypium mustelinum]|uniref:NADH dehydrogenase [ubiquinone] 1 alpha subcomplex subunit 12 n=3 Tax=Gossypium TaxID=3633 RepID=A0A5J5VL56_GOSBA|nr:hypothetical protein ES319_A05G078900v1 [Gossypium barbadense]TYH15965.1 hypothetical protein ES288_A05G081100v1 [Gossypium darwinii]TYJ33109.1 hypothetical protein E1A91_A05G080400v1 [Gossypium mustelinum]